MKKSSIAAIAALVILTLDVATFAQSSLPLVTGTGPGLETRFDLTDVGDNDLYEFGLGFALQFRDWFSKPWGYALSLGYSQYSVNQDASHPGANLYDFDGSLNIVPLGGSLLYNLYSGVDWHLYLNAGLRYLIVDSTITARNRDQPASERFDLRIDDSVLFDGSVNVDYKINPDFHWTFGLGYSADVTRGDANTSLGPAAGNVMESFFLSVALGLNL